MLGDGRDVVIAGASELLLGLDVLQHVPDAEFLSLACQPQTVVSCGELQLHRCKLVSERPNSRRGLDDLTRDLILQLLVDQLCATKPRLCCVYAADVEQAAGPDAPAQAGKVVLRVAE